MLFVTGNQTRGDDMREKIDPINLEVGQRIKAAREEKRWSRKELAARATITEQSLLYIETGRRGLSSHTIRSISRALSVTADFVVFGLTDTVTRLDYATQALVSLTEKEMENTLSIISTVADLIRGYE